MYGDHYHHYHHDEEYYNHNYGHHGTLLLDDVPALTEFVGLDDNEPIVIGVFTQVRRPRRPRTRFNTDYARPIVLPFELGGARGFDRLLSIWLAWHERGPSIANALPAESPTTHPTNQVTKHPPASAPPVNDAGRARRGDEGGRGAGGGGRAELFRRGAGRGRG